MLSRWGLSTLHLYTSVASLGGFLFGFDTGIIGGALPYIRDDPIFDPFEGSVWMSSVMQGIIVSSTLLGGGIGSIIGGILSDMHGRCNVIMLMDGLFILGGILMGVSIDVVMLILGRFIVGVAIGGSAAVIPVYIAEHAPPATRASFVSLNIVYVTCGQLAAYSINSILDKRWRLMLGLSLIPAIAQAVGLLIVKVHSSERETERASSEGKSPARYYEMLQHAPMSVRRQLRIGVMLQVLQQACGINTIMYFLPIILQQAGIRHFVQWSTIPAGCNVVGTLIGKATLDDYGRRKILVSSMIGVIVVLLSLSVAFGMASRESPVIDPSFTSSCPHTTPGTCSECISSGCLFCTSTNMSDHHESTSSPRTYMHGGSCIARLPELPDAAWARCRASLGTDHDDDDGLEVFEHGCPTNMMYSVLIFFLTCTYLLAFAPGLGTVPWVMGSEIFHRDFRGMCVGTLYRC